MQSIFGALLTAGYAASVSSQIAASDKNITDSTQAALTKSFSSAEAVAEQHPQYSSAIIAGAREAFLQGDDWAYTAGVIAILLGAVLVFFMFPKYDEEKGLLALTTRPTRNGLRSCDAGAPSAHELERPFRLRRQVRESLWIVPFIGGALGWLLGLASADFDAVDLSARWHTRQALLRPFSPRSWRRASGSWVSSLRSAC